MDNTLAAGLAGPITFIGWFAFFYLYHGYGITLGYHRLLTHKALVVPDWLKYLIASGGYFCLMGSPIVWVGVHRLHHQKSDIRGQDPHTPDDGFFHALLGWMTKMRNIQSDDDLRRQTRDMYDDPVFKHLGRTHDASQALGCLGACIVFRALLLVFFGPIALFANLLATGIVFFAPHLVNTVCHIPTNGYRSFDTKDKSRNVWWVGVAALGEGWHNNHHAIPTSARHGMKWYELDITWYAIWLLEKIGLAHKVVRPMEKPSASEADKLVPEPVAETAEPTGSGVR